MMQIPELAEYPWPCSGTVETTCGESAGTWSAGGRNTRLRNSNFTQQYRRNRFTDIGFGLIIRGFVRVSNTHAR
jgi:hypothetical protein